jgi:hypothetical protein
MTGQHQLDLLKSRRSSRGKAQPGPSEFQMQCMVADTLARWLSPGWFYSHIGHGERRERSAAIRLKRGGLKPGLPDFILVGPSKTCGFYFLELKVRPNGLTQEQKIFCDVARSAGAQFAVAYDWDEAIAILGKWGAVKVTVAA